MPNLHLSKFTCQQCSFGAFCFGAEKSDIVTKHHHLKRKETLHLPGDVFKSFYAIQSGALKTFTTDVMSNEIIHGLYLQKEVYGYDAIYTERYVFSAEALSETVLCEIPYQSFLQLLQKKPNLLSRMLYLMSQQLTVSSYLQLLTAQQKIAAFLLDLRNRLSPHSEDPSFLLPMAYQDIGDYLGLATETVSRILSLFKKNGMIAIDNKKIHLFKIKQLQSVVSGFPL
ncbi:MAG: helix-turn-helix domain-containing protein [Gammaproteobacteria bacterium]|nr:helix-turn-helix domain-containing protein [Gammaproteobacteria bacterium]